MLSPQSRSKLVVYELPFVIEATAPSLISVSAIVNNGIGFGVYNVI